MRSLKEGLRPCYNLDTLACDFAADGYRLPTEAEWEYACRAGTTSEYSFTGGESKLAEAAWFDANANGRPHPVGQKPANAWGLYDMHGNVSEWCYDVYGENYYAASPRENPCNIGPGEERVLRGGAWNSAVDACRSSARWSETPGLADVCFGYDAYGFRCVKRAGA
jgi:formylglycine-generating enzyme required for sulfatase activity